MTSATFVTFGNFAFSCSMRCSAYAFSASIRTSLCLMVISMLIFFSPSFSSFWPAAGLPHARPPPDVCRFNCYILKFSPRYFSRTSGSATSSSLVPSRRSRPL